MIPLPLALSTLTVHTVTLDELVRFASQVAGRELAAFVLDPRRPVLFEAARLPPLPRLARASGTLSISQHAVWEALRSPDRYPVVLASISIEALLDALAGEGAIPCGDYLVVDNLAAGNAPHEPDDPNQAP